MNVFWKYTRRMFRYRLALTIAFVAVMLDALAAFGGFGAVLALIRLLAGGGKADLQSQVREMLANPTLVAWVGDQSDLANLIPQDPFRAFAYALGVVLVISVFGTVMRFIHQATVITVSLRLIMRIRMEAFQRVLHAPLELLMQQPSADFIARINFDATRLGRGIQALMGKAVRDLAMGIAYFTWALFIDWKMTSLFVVAMPLVVLCARKFGKRIRRASKYAMRQTAVMIGALQESIQNPQVVRTHNAEGYERRRFNRINRALFRQEMRARTARALATPLMELIALGGVMSVTLMAAWYIFKTNQATTESMVGVLIALVAAGTSIKPLGKLNNDLQESAAAAKRIDEVLTMEIEPISGKRFGDTNAKRVGIDLPRHRIAIDFEDVHYTYPAVKRVSKNQGAPAILEPSPALCGVTLEVPFGQTIAIVGPNGCGKSTLLSMLPRLIAPSAGRITIDGKDIGEATLRSLREQIAVVTQQSVLFAGSIADNIAYARGWESRETIVAVAKAAHAHEFISAMPEGYDTVLGESGSGLSGGQKQRLCIARAMLRDPAILILDEATSQIDTESETKINEALRTLRKGKTTFLIAHRMSTIVDADVIIVMDQGKIIAQGKHESLMESCDLYRTLHQPGQ